MKISDEEFENYKKIFIMFDKVLISLSLSFQNLSKLWCQDGDGTVSTKELGAVMRSLGESNNSLSLGSLRELNQI